MANSNKSKKIFGIKEIAEKANVSIATVDRVIHKRGGVARKTEEKIQKIIEEYDYQPNLLASRLRSNKTYTLSVLVPRVSPNTDFWAAPMRGIEKAFKEIRQFGIEVRTYLYDLSDKKTFTSGAETLLKDEPDGVLIAPLFVEEAQWFVKVLSERKIPYLFIDTEIEAKDNLTYIGPDIYRSGFVGAQLSLFGIRRSENGKVLVINHTSTANDSDHIKEIERGFVDFIRDSGRPIEVRTLDFRGVERNNLEEELLGFLDENPETAAIFVTNSRVFKIAEVLKRNDRRGIILIGFDYIEENIRYLEEGLIDFLICHKPEEQGYRGVMNLYQRLVLLQEIEQVQYMPIDIITKENHRYYSN